MPSRMERVWRWFAIVVVGFAAAAGMIAAISTVYEYHALTARGIQTTAIARSAWQVKGGWECSVSFTDASGMRRVETVSACTDVQRGQSVPVTYDRSDPSAVEANGSVTAPSMWGSAALSAAFSVALSLCAWVLWRKQRVKLPVRTHR